MKPVHLIGVPLDLGAGRRGVDMGPSSLRIAGIASRIAALGRVVEDKGDIPAPIPETQQLADATKKYVREIARVCGQLYDGATRSLEAGALPVVLGGDHSLAAGSVAASADWVRRTTALPLGLIWMDPHGDMNAPNPPPAATCTGCLWRQFLATNRRNWRRSGPHLQCWRDTP